MPAVDLEKAVEAAKAIVRQAHQEGKLQQLTNRIVRKEIEKQLELEEGALEEKEYKKKLNDAVKQAVSKDSLAGEESQQEQSPKNDKKTKLKAKPKERKPRPKTTSPSSSKKPNNSDAATVEKQKKAESTPVSTDAERSKKKLKVKSKEIIDDDDEEITSPRAKVQPTDSLSSKKSKKRLVQTDDEAEGIKSATPPKKRSKTKDPDITVDPKKPMSVKENDNDAKEVEAPGEEKLDISLVASGSGDTTMVDGGIKSDSEMSVLIDDEPPKRKKKGKTEVKKTKSTAKEKKSKEPKAPAPKADVSPEEEQLKKMKALVFACGVRKVWSKELKDIESHTKQIAHIRGILAGLGMKGRFSLEQARAIKEKRELQQEIEEVREFAAKHAGEGRPKRAAGTSKAPVSADTNSDEESEEEEVTGPSRRKNARQSIMAFLEDQSDED